MAVACAIVFLSTLVLLCLSVGGYWGIVACLGGISRAAPAESFWPEVSLIIPAHNEAAVIGAKLENALAGDYPAGKLEVVVADDGSADGTVEIARGFEGRGVRVLAFPKRRGKASVLNDAAAEEASGEVLCFCDANVMFRPDALGKRRPEPPPPARAFSLPRPKYLDRTPIAALPHAARRALPSAASDTPLGVAFRAAVRLVR